jgi:DNA-binding NarL/FixJ family response regulator
MSISTEARPAPTTANVLIVDDHDLVAMSLALYLRSEGLLAQRHAARSRDGILTAAATMNPGVVLLDLDLGRGPDARSSTAPRSSLDSAAPAGASSC